MNTTAIVASLAIAAVPLTACGRVDAAIAPLMVTSTVTITAVPGSPPNSNGVVGSASREWTAGPDGTALFTVGAHSRDGLTAIAMGRYEVKVAPGARGGNWMLCDAALCGPAYPDYATVVGHAVAPYSSTVYIGPKSRTLWVDKVTLSPISTELAN